MVVEETTISVTINTKDQRIINRVKNALNSALLELENDDVWLYWDIEEVKN